MRYIILLLCLCLSLAGRCQVEELQQLAFDIEKLAQLKNILSDLYKGYQIISGGYNAIKDISKGNFNLHKDFLDGLLQVSPAVQKYKRIADIVSYQLRIAKEYKAAFNQFSSDKNFTVNEIQYLSKVYSNLFNESLKCLDELSMVITAGKLRMSDDERLKAIDQIFSKAEDQYSFLRKFNSDAAMLAQQRSRGQTDIDAMKKVYGLN